MMDNVTQKLDDIHNMDKIYRPLAIKRLLMYQDKNGAAILWQEILKDSGLKSCALKLESDLEFEDFLRDLYGFSPRTRTI